MKVLAAICFVFLIAVLSNYAASGSSNTTEISETSSDDDTGSGDSRSTDVIGSNIASSNDTIGGEETSSDDTIGSTRGLSKFAKKAQNFVKSKLKAKCLTMLEKGQKPTAFDSNIKQFGYPEFSIKQRSYAVNPKTSLSTFRGTYNPINIGESDYIIAGIGSELLVFCACFETAKIIGKTLGQNGKWDVTGNIKIQMENVDTISGKSNSAFEILFKYSLDKIVKYINPAGVIKGMDCSLFGKCPSVKSKAGITDLLKMLKPYLPFDSENAKATIINIIKKKQSPKDMLKELKDYIKDVYKRREQVKKKWIGWANIKKTGKFIVTLTMYPKPENTVRTTYTMVGATATLGNVGDAIKQALDRK